jgi:hypothetical protein
MKLLLGLIVVAPLVILVVGTIRGRVQMRSCCAVPADQDGRMTSAYAGPARLDTAHDAQTVAKDPAAH